MNPDDFLGHWANHAIAAEFNRLAVEICELRAEIEQLRVLCATNKEETE